MTCDFVEFDARGIYAIFRRSVFMEMWKIGIFGLRKRLIAFRTIVALKILIMLNVLWLRKIEKRAAYLRTPYLAWVTIASALNLGVYLLNP